MVTRWSPDTCNCVIEYDDNVSLTNIVNRCSFHASLGDDVTVFNTVMEENPRKNRAFQHILDNGPASLYDLTADGTHQIKAGININWTWTGTAPNRVLTLTITGTTLTNAQRNSIQNALNTRFGTGKVVLG